MKLLVLFALCGYVLASQISFVILGASGDLAKRKIYPALLKLYSENLLPEKFNIIGYARSSLSNEEVKSKIDPFLEEKDRDSDFFKQLKYIQGSYDKASDFENLNKQLDEAEGGEPADRIFYLSIPPNVFESSAINLDKHCRSKNGYSRIVIEKPFGRDLVSFHELSKSLNSSFTEEETYRIDHFVGKEVVQNIYATRFANPIFSRSWDRESIESISIIFKEEIDLEGRGGYFDQYGMIRDVVQNHLMQILTMVTMDEPQDVNEITKEKIKLLNSVRKLNIDDVVVAQYKGYNTDASVKNGTTSETFSSLVLHIDNDRWKGVPVYMKAGKALDERLLQVVIKYKPSSSLFPKAPAQELVLRVQPNESIYLRAASRVVGSSTHDKLESTILNHEYGRKLPDAYVKLVGDVINGDKTSFVTEEEINVCWEVFDDVLSKLDAVKGTIAQYDKKSSGPIEELKLLLKYNIDAKINLNADS